MAYVKAFAGRWNIRDLDTEEQTRTVLREMSGRELTYGLFIEDNGLPSGSGESGVIMPERKRRYQEAARLPDL